MADGWWNLDGAITSCVAAYQAIGAASYAASKVNLFSPGTNDLTEGSATPSWSSAVGWTFANNANQALSTGIVPDANTGAFVQFNGVTTNDEDLFGVVDGTKWFLRADRLGSFAVWIWNNTVYNTEARINSGNMGMLGKGTSVESYLDGIKKATTTKPFSATTSPLVIGKGPSFAFTGNVTAAVIYSSAITEAQAALVCAAMSELGTVVVDLTAADLTLAQPTFDVPTLTNTSGAVDLTALDLTLAAVTFDAPTLTNVWVTPACRTFTVAPESRAYTVNAESRAYVIPKESRGLKILCAGNTTYAPSHTYSPLVAKDFTLAQPTFDAPYLGYSISGNAGVAGATVTFGAASTTSGVDGSYRFDGLAAGTKGTVTATKAGYEFYPQRKYIHTMSADVTHNFTATQMTTTYYVRTDGNDTTGDGSTGSPWLTITKAITASSTGGAITIKVGTGTYAESTGWSKNFTNIVVIEPESGTLGDVIISSTATTNFTFGNVTNLRLRKLDFEEGANVVNWNILFTEGVISNIDLIDCRIARNVSTNTGRGNLYFNSTTATNVVIDGCDFPVSQNSPAAIEVVTRTSVSGLTITGCTFPESTGGTTYYSAISLKSSVGTGKFIDNVEISNLTISDLKHVIAVYIGHDTAAQSPITNVNLYDCTITGDDHVVAFEFGVDGALIDHCTVNAVGTYGFVIKESDGVEISNCTVNSGTNSAIYFKAARGANAHHNTITATQGYGFRLAANLAPNPDTKCSNWLFQNNIVNVSGTGKALIIGGDADDAGGGICDYNTYQNNSGLGSVRNDADVQSLAELQAAWADYDVTTNDSHSSVI